MVGSPHDRRLVAVAVVTFVTTLLFVVAVGRATGVGGAVYLPMSISFAVVFAGIPLAYRRSPSDDDDQDDED